MTPFRVHVSLTIIAVAAPFACASVARATYIGLALDDSTPPLGTIPGSPFSFGVNVWTAFTNPGDRLLGITGAFLTVLNGGSFYQDPLGGDTAPSSTLFPSHPALRYDTFVTIGLRSVPSGGSDGTQLEPGSSFSPGIPGAFSGGWFNSDPSNDQGVPGAHGLPATALPGILYVRVAQLTVQNFSAQHGIFGRMTVVWQPAGTTSEVYTPAFFAAPSGIPPAPGAIPLLAIGALNGSRRRRA